MRKAIAVINGICLFFLAQAGFACDYPERATIPNGATATKDEMIEGQRGVKKFVAEIEVYLECIVEEEKLARLALEALDTETEHQREQLLNKKYNAAVEEMELLAARFNTEVQSYKSKDQ